MKLQFQWDDQMEELVSELCTVSENIASQLKSLLRGRDKDALIQLFSDQSALVASVIDYCRKPPPRSCQTAGTLLRTLLEGCISIFAFCKDPKGRAELYLDFLAVLDFRFACSDEKNIGCPFLRKPGAAESAKSRKELAAQRLAAFGSHFLVSKNSQGAPTDALQQALRPGQERPGRFRKTWYPETREQVLSSEGMRWLHEVIYKRLCSCVHSDAAASKILEKLKTESIGMFALELWGAAMYRIVDTFQIGLPASHKCAIRIFYTGLQ